MKTKLTYYLILTVYILLWTCQLIACHLTHSLIILVDSYINLYKILDISLGILHLQTQHEVRKRSSANNGGQNNLNNSKNFASAKQDNQDSQAKLDKLENKQPVRVFARSCTYQFKRLPLLGSFVNRLFLAALLMSAAIEGIQTCFHSTHGANNEQSILLAQPLTYPAILVAFALVGAIMQWCLCKAHEMCGQELESESLLNLNVVAKSQKKSRLQAKNSASNDELSANQLIRADEEARRKENFKFEPYPPSPFLEGKRLSKSQRNTICLGGRAFGSLLQQSNGSKEQQERSKRKFVLNSTGHRSYESVPKESLGADFGRAGQISLKSFKACDLNQGDSSPKQKSCCDANNNNNSSKLVPIQTISGFDLEAKQTKVAGGANELESIKLATEETTAAYAMPIVGYCISPFALATCALINYLIHDELLTEIADASLTVLVVVLLFAASYPPMKKAGRVLLQTAPDGVDLDRLRESIKSASPLILDIEELHVWSLTSTSNLVATCKVVLDRAQASSQKEVSILIEEIKFRLLDSNIKCSTIQPVYPAEPKPVEAAVVGSREAASAEVHHEPPAASTCA